MSDKAIGTPATLPICRAQPEPISTQVIQQQHSDGWWTTISRVFAGDEGRDCRLCPAKMCGLDEYGHCIVCVPVRVPDHLAPTFPLFGDARLVATLAANRAADNR